MGREKGGLPVGVLLLATLAGCHPGVPTDKVSALVTAVSHGQASVRRIFDGPPGSGLTGAGIAGGTRCCVVVWITADGKTLISGNVFDARGRDLTEIATLRLVKDLAPEPVPSSSPAPPSSPSSPGPVRLAPGAFRAMADGVRFFRGGTGKRTLWIFLDPDCIWCHRLTLDLKAHPLPADVSVNWVPVAFLKPSSVGRAETVLAGGLPALDKDETRFDETTEEGGVPETHAPDLEAAVRKNTRILGSIGGKWTPTVVFRDGTGGTLRFDGYPRPEVLERIAEEAR
jgi:thiol:disulfide interchange protein DsbG